MYAVYTHRAVPVCKYSLKIEMCVFALLQLLLQQNHHLLISAPNVVDDGSKTIDYYFFVSPVSNDS